MFQAFVLYVLVIFAGTAGEMCMSRAMKIVAGTPASRAAQATDWPWLPAVASSLTELFAPELMADRIAAICEKYPWIDPGGLDYFRTRLRQAPRDSAEALSWVTEHAVTDDLRDACVAALRFKCDVLWSLLDATELGARGR